MIRWPHLRAIAGPVAFVAGALLLRTRVVESPEMAAQMTRGLVGPASWPTILLWVIAAFSLIWAAQRIRKVQTELVPETPSDDALATPFTLKIGAAILLILLYGYLLAVIGFATATLLYIVIWCVLGGIRKPIQIALIGVLGTTTLLYLFVKLAKMPLERGQGIMGEASIALYRLLGIY